MEYTEEQVVCTLLRERECVIGSTRIAWCVTENWDNDEKYEVPMWVVDSGHGMHWEYSWDNIVEAVQLFLFCAPD